MGDGMTRECLCEDPTTACASGRWAPVVAGMASVPH